MIKDYRVVRALAEHVAQAVKAAHSNFRTRELQSADEFVPGIVTTLREGAGQVIQGLQWGIEVVLSASTHERAYEADLLSVFTLNLSNARVSTGFLANAHIVARASDTERLRERCREMLERSSASFIFLLSGDSVCVVPAVAVLQTRGPLARLYARSPQRFFEEHFECFLGDAKLSATTGEGLKALCFRCHARHALLIKGEDRQPELF